MSSPGRKIVASGIATKGAHALEMVSQPAQLRCTELTMTRAEVAGIALVVFLVASGFVVAKRGRENRKLALLTAAGLVCLGLFLVVNVLDWPGALLSTFWAQHAIVAATVSTIPLAGIGFFAFKHYDTSVQEGLDEKIAATGRSGLVDHLVDVDVALSLLSMPATEILEWRSAEDEKGKPLRWLRGRRDRLGQAHEMSDPRLSGRTTIVHWAAAQDLLADEAVRRLMAGIRDWGPLLARSRQGERDLIDLGTLRLDLLAIERCHECSADQIAALQRRCRTLAWRFESSSSPRVNRPELLDPTENCPHQGRRRGQAAGPSPRRTGDHEVASAMRHRRAVNAHD